MPSDAAQKVNGLVVLVSGALATISGIWGYDAVTCSGIVAGAISAVMRAGFLVFVHPPTLAACLGLLALFAGISYSLVASTLFRARQELVTFVVPVLAFAGGVAIGQFGHIGLTCALSPWA